MGFDQADRRRSGDSGRTGPVPSPVRPPGARPPCVAAGTPGQPQGKMQDQQGRGAPSVPVTLESAVHRGGGLRRPVPWRGRRGLTEMQTAKTCRNDVLSVFSEGSNATPPDRGMYFILRLTQLIVRSDSRLGVLRYKIAPKCLLAGPLGQSGVGRNSGVAGTVRSYNLVFTYPSHRLFATLRQPWSRGTRRQEGSPAPAACAHGALCLAEALALFLAYTAEAQGDGDPPAIHG